MVYASKFKPIEASGVTAGLHASPVNPTSLVIHREPRKPRESTQNAHDWVWLGRATMDPVSNRNSTVSMKLIDIVNSNLQFTLQSMIKIKILGCHQQQRP